MKLKQALVLGLTTAVLAIPALAAADEATNTASLPSSVNADQKADVTTPANKEIFHKKGPKSLLDNDSIATKKMDRQKATVTTPASKENSHKKGLESFL